jgi:hypothetical protein
VRIIQSGDKQNSIGVATAMRQLAADAPGSRLIGDAVWAEFRLQRPA